jgi:hypothetical protein
LQNSVGDLINGTTIRDNIAAVGGGMYVFDAIAFIADSVIASNFALVRPPPAPSISQRSSHSMYIREFFSLLEIFTIICRLDCCRNPTADTSSTCCPALWRCSGDCRFSATQDRCRSQFSLQQGWEWGCCVCTFWRPAQHTRTCCGRILFPAELGVCRLVFKRH